MDLGVELRIQDSGSADDNLLTELLGSCAGALRGGGLFAWSNRHGAQALLDAPTFVEFLANGSFTLVVGMDSITDTAAIELLAERAADNPSLNVRAFLHGTNTLFHPKMAWFIHADRLVLITGSGNLTMGGLRGNWEAFVVATVVGAGPHQLEQQIEDWLAANHALLLPLDDARVAAAAANNTGRERDFRRLKRTPPPPPEPQAPTGGALVAEIPKGGARWNQANFSQEVYQTFFGATVGTQRTVMLQAVSATGALGDLELRPSVEVASHNYRFELADAAGKAYPTNGRPIGAFVHLVTGVIVYQVLLPGDPGYSCLSTLLDSRLGPAGAAMRRLMLDSSDLRTECPALPLWAAATEDL